MNTSPIKEARHTGYWMDRQSPLPSESKTICSCCGAEKRYHYRMPFCGNCGAKMIGERKAQPVYRDEYLYG